MPLVQMDTLAQERLVVRYDARGHGVSGDLRSAAAGDWAELAADQVALIDQLGIERLAIGGASMGAATALHAALLLGDRVERLVLVIPPTAWATRAGQVDLYLQMARAVESDGVEALVSAAAQIPPPDPFLDDADWLQRRVDTLRSTPTARLAAAFRGAAVAVLPSEDAIATLAMPTLVLAWSGDPGHPVSTAERLGELMGDCVVHIASDAAQLATWTSRCADFLRETGA